MNFQNTQNKALSNLNFGIKISWKLFYINNVIIDVRRDVDNVIDLRAPEVVPVLMIATAGGQSQFLIWLLVLMIVFFSLFLLLLLLLLLNDATAVIDVRCVVVDDADVGELYVGLRQTISSAFQRLQIFLLNCCSDSNKERERHLFCSWNAALHATICLG